MNSLAESSLNGSSFCNDEFGYLTNFTECGLIALSSPTTYFIAGGIVSVYAITHLLCATYKMSNLHFKDLTFNPKITEIPYEFNPKNPVSIVHVKIKNFIDDAIYNSIGICRSSQPKTGETFYYKSLFEYSESTTDNLILSEQLKILFSRWASKININYEYSLAKDYVMSRAQTLCAWKDFFILN